MSSVIAVCRYCETEVPADFHKTHVALRHENARRTVWPDSAMASVVERIRAGESIASIAGEYGVTTDTLSKVLVRRFGHFWSQPAGLPAYVARRSRIVAQVGHRWSKVRTLRKRGASWAAIERQVTPPS